MLKLPVIICILLLLTISVFAQEPSPAGGGMLLLDGKKAYAFVPSNDALVRNYHEGFTIDGWLYLEEYPKKDEAWVLLHKPDSFLLALLPSLPGAMPFRKGRVVFAFAIEWKGQHAGHGGAIKSWFRVPLRQWLYFYAAVGKKRMDDFTILDGDPTKSLVIGRKLTDDTLSLIPGGFELTPFPAALDELRISGIAPELEGGMQIYLGIGNDRPPNISIPKRAFQPDKKTVALWHFDDKRMVFSDASQNGLTMFAKDGAFNPMIFPVLPKDLMMTVWGKVKGKEQ